MSNALNPHVPPPLHDAAARLAEIKRRAAEGAPAAESRAITEEELYDEAAWNLAVRRAERGDLVGSLIWEKIARHETQARPSRPEASSPDLDGDQVVPANRARPDRQNGE